MCIVHITISHKMKALYKLHNLVHTNYVGKNLPNLLQHHYTTAAGILTSFQGGANTMRHKLEAIMRETVCISAILN
jgi:hypothetical protein